METERATSVFAVLSVAVAAACVAHPACAQSLSVPRAQSPATSGAATSTVFDHDSARAIEERRSPRYTESIVVEGRDPDARRTPRKPLERRFADSLAVPVVPPLAALVSSTLRPLDTTPCPGTVAQLADLGSQFRLYGFCP